VEFILSSLKKRCLTFFLGAGVSVSCGLPLWGELKDHLFEEIGGPGVDYEAIRAYLRERERESKLPENIENYPEVIFTIAEDVNGKDFIDTFLLRYFSRFKINPTYRTLISLMRWGYLTHIFTTNQDTVLPRVLIKENILFHDVIPWKDGDNLPADINVYRPIIFSLHGHIFRPGSILTGIDNICGDSKEIYKNYQYDKVQPYLNQYDYLVVIGYRGADKDIIELFRKYLGANQKAKIIWTYRSRSPDLIKAPPFKYLPSNQIETFKIKSADDFFNQLFQQFDFHSGKTKVFLKFIPPHPKKFKKIKVYGSVAVVGDYGVYANGKMLQYTLNLPCEIWAKPHSHLIVKFFYFDPFQGKWRENKPRAESIRKILTTFIKNYEISFYQSFPPGAGLGDAEPAGLTVLAYYLLESPDSELLWQIFQKLATNSPYYPHTSYLRPFASFFPPSSYSLGKRKWLPREADYKKDKDWKTKNQSISLKELALTFSFSQPEVLLGIGYLPRGFKASKSASQQLTSADTGAATTEVIQSPQAFCQNIAQIGEEFLKAIERQNYNLAGKYLYAILKLYQQQRAAREIEMALTSKLMEKEIITGGKISGSGPGGAQVYLCKADTFAFTKGDQINQTIHPYIQLLEVSHPQGKDEEIQVTDIKQLIEKWFTFKNGYWQPVWNNT